jgi:hypothetical protein
LGLLSPHIPSFSGIHKVGNFFIKSQIPGPGWEVSKVDTETNTGRYKITTVLGSMTCCKIGRDFLKSQEILVGLIQTFHSIFLEIQAGDLQRGWQ